MVERVRWATLNTDFLRCYYPYARGFPSHDTVSDVLNALNAKQSKRAMPLSHAVQRGADTVPCRSPTLTMPKPSLPYWSNASVTPGSVSSS